MCQPYIESATALSDIMCVYDKKKFEWHFSGFFSNTGGRLVVEFID